MLVKHSYCQGLSAVFQSYDVYFSDAKCKNNSGIHVLADFSIYFVQEVIFISMQLFSCFCSNFTILYSGDKLNSFLAKHTYIFLGNFSLCNVMFFCITNFNYTFCPIDQIFYLIVQKSTLSLLLTVSSFTKDYEYIKIRSSMNAMSSSFKSSIDSPGGFRFRQHEEASCSFLILLKISSTVSFLIYDTEQADFGPTRNFDSRTKNIHFNPYQFTVQHPFLPPYFLPYG